MENLIQEFLKRDKEKRLRFFVCGDIMLDEYYLVDAKKLSPEFPVITYISLESKPHHVLPGAASNVVCQFKNFNVDVKLVSLIDDYSFDIFNKSGINIDYCLKMDRGAVPVKRRFYVDNHPVFRWDVESPRFGLDNGILHTYLCKLFYNNEFTDADVMIFSDYNKGLFTAPYFARILKSNIITIVDPKGKDIDKWKGCAVFKPNSVEAEALSGQSTWRSQCGYFKNKLQCKAVVITQEGDGVAGIDGDKHFEYRPKHKTINVESVCGAGDNFVSFLGMAMGHGFTVAEASEIAFEAGALYVQKKYNTPITPKQLREKIDSIEVKFASVEEIKKECEGKKLIFSNGAYDAGLTRAHVECFKFAKNQGDKLVAALNSDESVKRLKGKNRPILPLEDRMHIVASLEMVDYVVSFDEDTPLRLIRDLRPSIVVKGGDYLPEEVVGKDIAEVRIFPRYNCLSTTDKLEKIKENNLTNNWCP